MSNWTWVEWLMVAVIFVGAIFGLAIFVGRFLSMSSAPEPRRVPEPASPETIAFFEQYDETPFAERAPGVN